MTRKERKQLEQKAVRIIMGTMMYNGMEKEVTDYVKQQSNSDIIAFLDSMED